MTKYGRSYDSDSNSNANKYQIKRENIRDFQNYIKSTQKESQISKDQGSETLILNAIIICPNLLQRSKCEWLRRNKRSRVESGSNRSELEENQEYKPTTNV